MLQKYFPTVTIVETSYTLPNGHQDNPLATLVQVIPLTLTDKYHV